jgi:hypothetical protein
MKPAEITEAKESGWVTFVLLIFRIFCGLFGTFVGMKVWNLFMPSLFGLPALSFAQFYGVRLVLWCVSNKEDSNSEKTNKAKSLLGITLAYALTWGVAVRIA